MHGNEFDGKLIGITRPAERVKEAVKIIEEHGGKAMVAPTLELQISNSQSLVDLCKMVGTIDWLIFTSPTAIISLFKHCKDLKERLNPNCQIAVIGPRTEKFLQKYGIESDLVPTNYTAEGLLDAFNSIKLRKKKIGIPRTISARDKLPDVLMAKGAQVHIAEAYSSELPVNTELVKNLITNIIDGKIDAVTFTSTLTVNNLFKMANDKEMDDMLEVLRNGKIIVGAIGPVTAQPLRNAGIPVLIPEEYTVKAMLEKLMDVI
jgi:uroporphyrinogen-III synthase